MLPLGLAVFLHEIAHFFMLKLYRVRIVSFHPAPFGLCIEYDENLLSLGREVVVCAAGCAINLLTFLFSLLLYRFGIDILDFGTVSFVLALVNMMPTEPLDGGRILRILITCICGPEAAYRASAVLTYIFGFLVFLFASYMLLTSQGGIYPLLFSIYLFGRNAKMLKNAFLDENESICENLREKQRIRKENRV